MKKFFLASSAAAMAAFGLIACGDESTINQITQDGIPQIAAGESLGKCSDKNVGEMFFVTDSSAVYYCADGKWKSLNGKDGSSSVDTLVMNNVDTVYVRDTVILNNAEAPAKLDTIVLDNRDTLVTVTKDTVYVYDTTVVKYEPEYDTVTTAYLNQEMLADGKYGILVDKRDNKVYRTVEIGQQTWMAQNLDYNDGGVTSYCFENEIENCEKYGRLYTWAAALNLDEKYNDTNATTSELGLDSVLVLPAQGICPEGFHVPDTSEFQKLVKYVEASNMILYGGEPVGYSLKSVNGFEHDDDNVYATDRYGMSLVGSGDRNWRGTWEDIGVIRLRTANENRVTQSATFYKNTRYFATSAKADVFEISGYVAKAYATPLRCLKD